MLQETEKQVSLQDYLRVLYRGRWLILISFLTVLSSTVYFTQKATPIYQVTATIMIDTNKNKSSLSFFEVTGVGQQETVIKNQVEILKSKSLAEDVADALIAQGYDKRLHLLGFSRDRSGMAEQLRNLIQVSPRRDTDIIDIRVEAPDPQGAAIIANTVAAVYRVRNMSINRGEMTEVKKFLQEQLAKKAEDLQKSENDLKNFKEQSKVVALPDETREFVRQLTDFETLYNQAQTDLGATNTRLKYLRAQYAEQIKDLPINISSIISPLMDKLREEITNLESVHASLIAQNVPDNHPKMVELRQQIQNTKNKILEEAVSLVKAGGSVSDPLAFSQKLLEQILVLQVDAEAAGTKATTFKKLLDEYYKRLESLPEKTLQLARLERQSQLDEKIFLMMKEKLEETKITEAGQIGNVSIIDKAEEPKYPIKPKKKMNILLGALVGLGLGIGITFLLEYMDTSIKTIEDVERLIGLSVLGAVPTIDIKEKEKRRKQAGNGSEGSEQSVEKIEARLVTHFEPKSPISESYRTMRTNIQYAKPESPPRTLLVTSAAPGEGKSTTVANLAITMAQMGNKVLLVDTDFRRPVLHSIFGLEREEGLTSVLIGKKGVSSVLKDTTVENLSLISCGAIPPNPSELLGSKRMVETLREMRENFDFVLFDSPPIIAVTDAAVLSTMMDGVLIVIESGKVNKEAVLRGKNSLENVKATILGTILNNVNAKNQYGSYYYYYYYYYYYGHGEDGKGKIRRKKHTYGY